MHRSFTQYYRKRYKATWPCRSGIHNLRCCECREHLLTQCEEKLKNYFARERANPNFLTPSRKQDRHRYGLFIFFDEINISHPGIIHL